MVQLKRIKADHVEHTEYGTEHWCRLYFQYNQKFYKIWYLVLSDKLVAESKLLIEILKEIKRLRQKVEGIASDLIYLFFILIFFFIHESFEASNRCKVNVNS